MTPVPFSLTFSHGAETVTAAKDSVFRLLAADGLASGQYTVFSEEFSQLDGAYVQSVRVASRRLHIVFEVNTFDGTELIRSRLMSFFDPKTEGTLTVLRGGRTRSIGYYPEKVDFIQPTLCDMLKVELTLFCPKPYFSAPSETVLSSSRGLPLLTFPFTLYPGAGLTAGLRNLTNDFVISNPGDSDAGFTAILTASHPVTNPKITGPGGFIRILDTMGSGDEYLISTIPGDKKILKNGQPVFCFDRESTFFSLPKGNSTVTVTADSGEDTLSAEIVYRLKYLGV